MKAKTKHSSHKRYGHHQKRSKHFHATYWPYLPAVLIIGLSILLSGLRPSGTTLAFATDMSVSGLLSATNTQRANNSRTGLQLNQALINAAQAKANDMVTRNYWSHNTPDGQEPWIFFDQAGYKYLKAGENLAYGFTTSSDTVVGWMNSASHKANLLESDYTEVGFGFANSNDFNNSGQETVVVAMYGKPQVLASSSPVPAAPAAPAPKPIASTPPAASQPTAPTSTTLVTPKPAETPKTPVATAAIVPPIETASVPVTRIQALTGGQAPWATLAAGSLAGAAITMLLIKHGFALRRLLKNSEKFVLHHPLFDSTVLSLVILAITLSQTVGFIR